jgi:hypothetical protein
MSAALFRANISVKMRTRFLKWIALFGAAGLLVPAELLFRNAVFHSSITTFEWWLWPSAIFTMALQVPNPRTAYTLNVLTLAVGVNVLLYATIGLVTWPLRYFVLRRNRSLDV